MLDSLKEAGRTIGHEIGRAWEVVSDGWRELFSRSSNALTHFSRGQGAETLPDGAVAPYPLWSLLAGEVEETDQEIVVRLELPGMEKSDCQVRIAGKQLILSGTKRFERVSEDSAFHVMERAYGAFERTIALPGNVRQDEAEASYTNGVLTVRLPKQKGASPKSIAIS